MPSAVTPPTTSGPPRNGRRERMAAFLGTTVEWYDFYIYGLAAAIAFGPVFFPNAEPGIALIASFATFWAGFLARPVGGVVFGHLGDKFGRKNTLVTTLLIMGVATFAIGLLPGHAQIGVAAPILLTVFRALQGFAVGGEWGGAVLLASESDTSQAKVRGGMFVQQGSPAGNILATLMFTLVATLPDEQFLAWGWRVPFLLSALLVVVGLVIRLKIEESEEFTQAKSDNQVVRVPIVELMRHHWQRVAAAVLASGLGIAMAYFISTFMLSYTTGELGIDRQVMLNILLLNAVIQFVWQPFASRIAERVGVSRFMVATLGAAALLALPMFLMVETGNPVLIWLALALSTVAGAGYYAVLAGFLANAFPVHIRYTGVSTSYQLCSTLIGGTTPLVAQFLLNAGGGSWGGVAVFYVALIAATIAGVLALGSLTARLSAKS
ncbi:MFS transporter [Nocardiopsis sp. HUAS JQ3]|uniref:MFS transporter n=1 Tax=Nocardiopsis sp. HUAS JQ3 TaxID=3061629 RepID=UPI0023A98E69|nr:MFS transporter [Nocardiopsis sp. HUAS JQ3]WDZ93280.1 MFS transporter [Nocardiopsis sp. HUAS JQ3]